MPVPEFCNENVLKVLIGNARSCSEAARPYLNDADSNPSNRAQNLVDAAHQLSLALAYVHEAQRSL